MLWNPDLLFFEAESIFLRKKAWKKFGLTHIVIPLAIKYWQDGTRNRERAMRQYAGEQKTVDAAGAPRGAAEGEPLPELHVLCGGNAEGRLGRKPQSRLFAAHGLPRHSDAEDGVRRADPVRRDQKRILPGASRLDVLLSLRGRRRNARGRPRCAHRRAHLPLAVERTHPPCGRQSADGKQPGFPGPRAD